MIILFYNKTFIISQCQIGEYVAISTNLLWLFIIRWAFGMKVSVYSTVLRTRHTLWGFSKRKKKIVEASYYSWHRLLLFKKENGCLSGQEMGHKRHIYAFLLMPWRCVPGQNFWTIHFLDDSFLGRCVPDRCVPTPKYRWWIITYT
jgi:hypothetical protein